MEVHSGRFKKPICIGKYVSNYNANSSRYRGGSGDLIRRLPKIFEMTYRLNHELIIKDQIGLNCTIGRGFISSDGVLLVIVFKDKSTGKFKIWISDEITPDYFYREIDKVGIVKIVTEFVNYYRKQADFIIEVQKHDRLQKFLQDQAKSVLPTDFSKEKRNFMLQSLKLENQFGI